MCLSIRFHKEIMIRLHIFDIPHTVTTSCVYDARLGAADVQRE